MTDIKVEEFTNEELMGIVLKRADIFILPIKHDKAKRYSKYAGMLGRMDPKLPIVKKNLPRIAVQLYTKRDKNFVQIMEDVLKKERIATIELLSGIFEKNMTVEELQQTSHEKLLDAIINDSKMQNYELDAELLSAQLKLLGIRISEEEKNLVKKAEKQRVSMLLNSKETANNEKIDIVKTSAYSNESVTPKKKHEREINNPEDKKGGFLVLNGVRDEKQADDRTKEERSISDLIEVQTKGSKNNKILQEEKKMGIYVGRIQVIGNFYNFAPIGELTGQGFSAFTENEIDKLLPKSQKRNINFNYSFYDDNQIKQMADFFKDGSLAIFQFDVDELPENRDSFGELNQTGYKISGIDCINDKKVRHLSDDGFYSLKNADILIDDIETKKIVRVNYPKICEGEQILINLKDGFYAGPYMVKYRQTADDYIIQPRKNDKSFLISGYSSESFQRTKIQADWSLYANLEPVNVLSIKPGETPIFRDIMPDDVLLESIKESIKNAGDGGLDTALVNYRESALSAAIIPEEIILGRIERLKTILSAEEIINENIEFVSDVVYEMLSSNKDDKRSTAIIETIIGKHPDIYDRLQNTRIMKERADSLRQEVDELELKKREVREEIQNLKETSDAQANAEREEVQSEELKAQLEKLGYAKNIEELKDLIKKSKDEVNYLEKHKSHLENDTKNLESQFVDLINRYSDRIADISFDGFMSNKMLASAAMWEAKENERIFDDVVMGVNEVDVQKKDSNELVNYLVEKIRIVRPQYNKNTIINLAICLTQGFLTVFSGAPGCGKTSICNIMARVLGMDKFDKLVPSLKAVSSVNRYVPVSVERGWTSKRDFIGYYNPLTKTFEENNREVFDSLKILNIEAEKGTNKFPYIILLDEANLSPMEYYWADFMNVCDDRDYNNTVNLGERNIFKIPETLHFVATINNDHTTETLSPRLIDRAWIISLPQYNVIEYGRDLNDEELEIINWEDLKNTFDTKAEETPVLEIEVQKVYGEIRKKLNETDITISPRSDLTIRKYCYVASRLMESDEYGNSSGIIALDYAVAQKVLPKLGGAGESYALWLESFKEFCNNYNMSISAGLLNDMIKRGNKRMNYFQFFN